MRWSSSKRAGRRARCSHGRLAAGLGAGFAAGFGLLACVAGAGEPAAPQSQIEGLDGWAQAVTGGAGRKWTGQRVAFPSPSVRPPSLGRLDSLAAPLSVHAASPAGAPRVHEVLRMAETVYALLAAAGLLEARGDGGQAGTWGRDLYLADAAFSGALLDASEPIADVDGARAFAVLDARLPRDRLLPCTAQALVEAELYELDPAEADVVRQGSAAYFAWLVSGESCEATERSDGERAAGAPLREAGAFFAFLRALGARMDENRGGFVQSMWHFARQRTWEGRDLRGSPDLLEAIAKSLELEHTKLEEIAGELATFRALEPESDPLQHTPRVAWSALPIHLPPVSPALGPLDSAFRLVDLEGARPGKQLRVWSRGESGVRWVLTATRLDATGAALASVNAPVRRYPDAELQLELDAETRFVLVSITNLAGGVPDPDASRGPLERSARLILDEAH
jgi:hypothetical protein